MSVTLNGTSGLTFNDGSTQNTGATGFGFKNRIINGAMMIDQRNAGAALSTGSGYSVDRWTGTPSVVSKFSLQQNAGSVTPPVGFTNYLGATSSSAYSVSAGDYFLIRQPIEGLNISDLAWGTANAATVTLSFKVYSSLTGTFGGSLCNSAQNRSYPFSFTIASANTWTTVSITISGDTTGTWLTTNGAGILVTFSLGTGTTYSGTAGAWSGSAYFSATGATSVVGTNGATFYITGVQLEKGSTATSFDYRPYGTELALCQRYYEVCAVSGFAGSFIMSGYASGSGQAIRTNYMFATAKRATPTVTLVGTWDVQGTGQPTVQGYSTTGIRVEATSTTSGIVYAYNNTSGNQITASAEL